MARATSSWRDADTSVTQSFYGDLSLADIFVPGLTILAHPDPRRVGEHAVLPDLALGREVRLSRGEPDFTVVGHAVGRPLAHKHVSRRPIRLLAELEAGTVTLDRGASHTKVEADQQVVTTERTFSAAEIARGVVLLLGYRVALLLHLIAPLSPETRAAPRFGLVGESDRMVRVRRDIHQAAERGLPVLLRGDTGTGKDLVARAIHDAGPRRGEPFVAVNMGAIPPSLAASELFGAGRGAFTGADRKKTGYFQHAHHGTLFLDEIGETPPEVQGLLLRALESGEVQPVGSVEMQKVDVLVITATDADLEAAIAAGRFRGPLYHRLTGYSIQLPALRERRDDIGRLLARFFDEEGSGERAWPTAKIVARLASYDWPGNVRELRNVARRLAMLSPSGDQGGVSLAEELLDHLLAPPAAPSRPASAAEAPAPASPGTRKHFRKPSEVNEDELMTALKVHRWRLKPTAAALGISRATLYRLIEACSRIRKAAELERSEIEEALDHGEGDLEKAATILEVSQQGLKMRMTELALER